VSSSYGVKIKSPWQIVKILSAILHMKTLTGAGALRVNVDSITS